MITLLVMKFLVAVYSLLSHPKLTNFGDFHPELAILGTMCSSKHLSLLVGCLETLQKYLSKKDDLMVIYLILQLQSVNKNHLKPDEKNIGQISTVHWLKIASRIQVVGLGLKVGRNGQWM